MEIKNEFKRLNLQKITSKRRKRKKIISKTLKFNSKKWSPSKFQDLLEHSKEYIIEFMGKRHIYNERDNAEALNKLIIHLISLKTNKKFNLKFSKKSQQLSQTSQSSNIIPRFQG